MTDGPTDPTKPNFNKHDVQVVRDAALDASNMPRDKERRVFFLGDHLRLVRSASLLADCVETHEVRLRHQEEKQVAEDTAQKDIEDLEARVKALEAENASFQPKVERLERVEHALGTLLTELNQVDFGGDTIISGLITDAQDLMQQPQTLCQDQSTSLDPQGPQV
jgi:hypothetical protein